jgi:hypothetical protein
MEVLLIAAVMYWVAAPDPVTAGARTASGTAAKAAGTGARSHWVAGRGQRQARRTKRRDRWWKAGGVRRAALRAEHAGVWSWGAGKTAAGVAAAAVRPVPVAMKTGWTNGRDRHRAKAGNRAAPVALDLPWWRREQPQVQPEEQAVGTAQEQDPKQAQEQGGERIQGGPQEQAAIEIGKSYSHCSRCLGNVTDYATAEACDGCGARFVELRPDYAEHVEQIKSERSDLPVVGPQSRSPHPSGLSPEQPAAMTVVGEKQSHCSRCLSPVSPDWTECRTCQAALTGFMTTSGAYLPRDPENRGSGADGWPMVAEVREIPDCDVHSQVLGTPGVPAAYDAEMKSGAWAFMCPDCFEQHGTGELGLGKGQRLALKVPTTDPAESLNSTPAPADGPIEQPGTDAYLPSRQGDPTRTPIRVEIYRAYVERGRRDVRADVRRLDTGASYHAVKDHDYRSGERGWTTFHTTQWLPSMAAVVAEVRATVRNDLGSMSVPYRIEWFIDGRPSQSLNSAPAPADGPTDGAPAPDATTPTTEGAAMPNVPTELRTHVAVQDFAQQIDSLSEASDFVVAAEKARVIGEQSRAGGFGGEMDLATDALEETARRFAQSVDALREQAHELAKTSLSVQGS